MPPSHARYCADTLSPTLVEDTRIAVTVPLSIRRNISSARKTHSRTCLILSTRAWKDCDSGISPTRYCCSKQLFKRNRATWRFVTQSLISCSTRDYGCTACCLLREAHYTDCAFGCYDIVWLKSDVAHDSQPNYRAKSDFLVRTTFLVLLKLWKLQACRQEPSLDGECAAVQAGGESRLHLDFCHLFAGLAVLGHDASAERARASGYTGAQPVSLLLPFFTSCHRVFVSMHRCRKRKANLKILGWI